MQTLVRKIDSLSEFISMHKKWLTDQIPQLIDGTLIHRNHICFDRC